jgi:flagellar basal body rod protein FlgG
MGEELVDLITTQHAFAANIKTIQTEDEMRGRFSTSSPEPPAASNGDQ